MSLFGQLSGALQSRGESGEANTFPPPPPPPPASPQMTVTGNGLLIGAAQSPPFEGNHTDFGDLIEGDPSVSRVFTIANNGDADLVVSLLEAPAGFTIAEGISATIAPSASDTFTLELPTTTVGAFAGDVSFVHNDPNYPGANPFTFAVMGEVLAPPPPPPSGADISVTGNGEFIYDGDAAASATNHTAFGTTEQGGGAITRTFTITNIGGSDLTLASLTVPTGFTIVEGVSATIAASATDTFQVQLDDSVVGSKSGDISFDTNVTGKSPFNFAISGTVSPPPPPPPPPPTEPSVALTAPANGDTSTALPITASANATANSPATSIVSAAFRLNGVTVATDNSGPPWSVDLSPDNGTYSVDVVVTDNLGGVNTSAPHTHTVNVSPPAGTTLTTLTIHNSSTTAQTTGFVTKAFAHQFKKADIPNGDYPQFQLTDGTPVPHTHWGKTTWTDGSWQMAGFILRVPSTVAGARTVTSSGSTLTAASHTDLTTGDPVRFITTNTLPTGINPATTYYVRLGTGTTITVHTTSAGAIANTGAVATSGAGSGTHTLLPGIAINIKNGGSAPAASALTNADITGSSDIKVEGVGARNITGTNTSSLNTGIADGEIFEIGTGPVGRVLRVYQEFNDGSTDNTQAGAWHYVFQLQNGSSGKYGLRHMARMQNGWTDVAGTVLGKTFLSLAVKDGGTTIHTLSKLASTKTLTVLPCGLITTNNSTNIAGHGGAMAVRITSSGTMPAGLSDTTAYYVNTWQQRYTLAFDAQTANFTVGQIITGATSTATAEIVGIEDLGTTGRLYLKNWSSSKDFRDNEIITDPLGGSATVNEALPFWTATHTLNYDGQTAEFTAGQVLTAANGASATIAGVVDSGTTGTLYLRGVSTSASFLNNAVITDALGGSADANGTTASVNLKPTNVITLYTNGYASRTGGTETVVTSAGSGTISMEVVPQLDCFCGGPFTANDAGEYNFIAAGGTGAETTCEVVTNRDYLISTKWWGPRATNLVPTQRASLDYKFDAYQEYYFFRDTSGPRNDIGYFPSYGLEHFHRQTPIDMRRIRVHGLQYGLQTFPFRRDATKNPVNLTSTTHANLGASISQNAWTKFAYYGESGWMTGSTGDHSHIWGEYDYSHYYFPHAYAYAVTAEPHYLDMVFDGATQGVLHNNQGRAETIAGVPYENVIWKNDASARANAWTLQALAFARIYAPVAGWNGADLKTYFDEIIDDNLVSNHADKDNGNAWQQTSRVQYTGNTLLQTWQQAYWVKVLCFLYGATEKASARDNAEDFLTFWGGIRSNFGLSWLSIPNHDWAEGIPTTHTDWSRLFPSRPWGGIQWNATTDTITYGYNVPALAELGTIEDGVQWLQRDGVVGGTVASTRYWVRDHNAGAKTFKLSTNSGLSDVLNITSSGSQGDSTRIYARLTPPYSDTWMSGSGGANDTKYEIYSAARYANAHGFTLPSGLLAAMDAFMATNGPSDALLIASIGNHYNATF